MDSREIPPPPSLQQQPPPGLIMSHFRNPNSGGSLMGPTSTSSQSIHHHRSVFGALGPPLDHQKNMDSLGFNDGSSPSSQPARFGIDQSQNQQQQVKKKRGRPRKYTPEGNIALGLAPASPLLSAASNSYGGGGGEGESGGVNANSADPPAKRNRGRPPGSSKKLVDPLGTAGSGFTPHVIEVKQGEVKCRNVENNKLYHASGLVKCRNIKLYHASGLIKCRNVEISKLYHAWRLVVRKVWRK